jgi:ABC-type transport system substrate-binding protein
MGHPNWGALALLLALAGATGCRDMRGPIGQRFDKPPEHGGRLQMATMADVRTLDPAIASDTTSSAVLQLLFVGLVDYGPDGHIVPMLAEHFTVAPDGLRYDFKLREGIRFHDGEELIADDIKRSLERELHHDTPSPAPSFYASIAGYEAFHEGVRDSAGRRTFAPELRGVVVDGRYLLHIDLSQADATFLPVLTLPFAAPVCRSAGRTYARNWATQSCGAGPFKLQEWQASREIVLTRHAGYYEAGKPYLDEVRWSLLMPALTQRFKFEEGDLDHLREFTFADAIAYRRDARWTPFEYWDPAKVIQGIFMNTQMKPFDNVELRRAVASAIDWDQIVSLRPGALERARQIVPPSIATREASPDHGQTFDVTAALEHMRKAGYAYDPVTRQGGYPGTIRYLGQATPGGELMPQMVQQQLAKIGIRMEMKMVSWPTFLAESSKRGVAQLGYAGWSMDFPDPSDFFEPILSSSAISEEESQNMAFYSNPEFDQLLKEAHSEVDPARRAAFYKRCEEIVRDEAPWAFGMHPKQRELMQPYVHGYATSTTHVEDVRFVWIDSAERQKTALLRRGASALALIRPWGRR